MKYTYKPQGVCSSLIEFELDGNVIHNIQYKGGCNGNLQAVSRLVDGMTVEEITKVLGSIKCGGRPTSCSDQLVKACEAAMNRTLIGEPTTRD